MAEPSTEPVGLWLGLQAGAFLGLYFGFSLALVSALTSPDELMRIVYLITIFPLIGGILLGPFLAVQPRLRRPLLKASAFTRILPERRAPEAVEQRHKERFLCGRSRRRKRR